MTDGFHYISLSTLRIARSALNEGHLLKSLSEMIERTSRRILLCRKVSYLTADCNILFESGEMKISQIY